MSEYLGEYIVSLTPKTFSDLRFHRHEEIVRCRDCVHWATEARFTGMCVGKRLDPDGFCVWGERQEEGGAMSMKLSAEQVRDANMKDEPTVFGMTLDEILQMIKRDAERDRTCELDGTIKWDHGTPGPYWQHELSCGHVITTTEPEPPNYCEECGAKIVVPHDN